MPKSTNSHSEAALILRGLTTRVDRLEEADTDPDSTNVFRGVIDSTLGVDTVATTTDSDASWVWDTSEWDFDEWAE